MTRFQPPSPPFVGQRGAALITSLIFLIVLTLIGVTAARMSSLEERMAGNLRDRALAMQAAELALRDAERDILNSGRVSGISDFAADCDQDDANNTPDDGLCYNGAAGFAAPVWTLFSMTAAPSVGYGDITGATAVPLVSAQPRYLIEGIRKAPPGSGDSFFYRITVRAQGVNANTVVMLQEVFKP